MATLIDVGTPGPALAGVAGANGGLTGPLANNTTQTTANTIYNLNQITLTAGTWVVTGICGVLSGTEILYLNLAGGGVNSWTVQTSTDAHVSYISAVVKVAGSTPVNLTGKNNGSAVVAHSMMTATQIA